MRTVSKYEQKRDAGSPTSIDQMGFTLLEILVALVMGTIFITAICALIIDQTQTHEDHQMKVMMQQNGRAALSILTNELMLAGYSPDQRSDGGSGRLAGFEIAGINIFKITYDSNANGVIKRKSGVENSYDELTIYVFDAGNKQLERNNNTNSFLENVEAFRVLYAYDKDDMSATGYGKLEPETSSTYWAYDSVLDGKLDTSYTLNSDGMINNTGPAISVSIDRIRAAKIWLLLRSNKKKNKDQAEIDIGPIPGDEITLDPDYSYRLYTTTVKLRNMYY